MLKEDLIKIHKTMHRVDRVCRQNFPSHPIILEFEEHPMKLKGSRFSMDNTSLFHGHWRLPLERSSSGPKSNSQGWSVPLLHRLSAPSPEGTILEDGYFSRGNSPGLLTLAIQTAKVAIPGPSYRKSWTFFHCCSSPRLPGRCAHLDGLHMCGQRLVLKITANEWLKCGFHYQRMWWPQFNLL